MKHKYQLLFLLLTALLFIAGCGLPNEKSVSEDYIKEHPDRIVISAIPGEGDSTSAYFYIKYKVKGTEDIKTEVWLYQEDNSGNWSVSKKGLPNVRY